MKYIDRYRGCLLGGAAGDALGYAVEFKSESEIRSIYGVEGIREYELDGQGIARFSDDTQMTLYTANALLHAITRGKTRGIGGHFDASAKHLYYEWYCTQTQTFEEWFEKQHRDRSRRDQMAWISSLPELFVRRSPGTTCLSACEKGANGTMTKPINNSKGCGGIMRVAPVGLYIDAVDRGAYSSAEFCRKIVQETAAELAALTHGHEFGWLPAAAFAHIVSILSHNKRATIRSAVEDSIAALPEAFPNAQLVRELQQILHRAIQVSYSDLTDAEAISQLGEGWVAEETLAIAVLCSLRHPHDFEAAIVAAVNHRGDSDSTGAVTGNIVGAFVGEQGIPKKYLDHLELAEVIVELADDLCVDCQISEYSNSVDGVWESKYITADYLDRG